MVGESDIQGMRRSCSQFAIAISLLVLVLSGSSCSGSRSATGAGGPYPLLDGRTGLSMQSIVFSKRMNALIVIGNSEDDASSVFVFHRERGSLTKIPIDPHADCAHRIFRSIAPLRPTKVGFVEFCRTSTPRDPFSDYATELIDLKGDVRRVDPRSLGGGADGLLMFSDGSLLFRDSNGVYERLQILRRNQAPSTVATGFARIGRPMQASDGRRVAIAGALPSDVSRYGRLRPPWHIAIFSDRMMRRVRLSDRSFPEMPSIAWSPNGSLLAVGVDSESEADSGLYVTDTNLRRFEKVVSGRVGAITWTTRSELVFVRPTEILGGFDDRIYAVRAER